ncbi:cytoplasmic protein [Phyllobacterium meliloti]|uniref:cytoplasmic protein n=1 Tax=Phyllobacterium meliloti TaxID=555317 RepID=UPI001D150E00|nr:cytoplasmic protein [Phyllobacterium sp. T1293]UGX84754.1 cytoplasmic protein [Phyllobacterium sp. T1293]
MAHIDWIKERQAFLATREAERESARQRLALQILCGEDLDTIITLSAADRLNYCRRLKRLIERERIKGGKGHWSYDLNRHIGLKQALDTLQKSMQVSVRAD